MKTHTDLYPQIVSFENLLAAARAAERCRRFRHDVGRFRTDLEGHLLELQRELVGKTYRPGGYRERTIVAPKRRVISIAPYRDRVVHHALCRVVMPLFERKMIHDLYSNRPGKGTHAAIRRCQEFAGRFPYVLKCDIAKYFASVDHEVLKATLRRTIRCADTLWLMDLIIDGSNRQEKVCTAFPGDDLADAAMRRVGLPIGNLTSQWFGGIHLSEFDHWVKEELRCHGYVRYVDDFLLFSDDKGDLADWREAIRNRLAQVRLRLHERKSRTYRTRDGVTFLGQRVWPWKRRICRPNVTAARRRLRWNVRQYHRGLLPRDGVRCRWMSWVGHAMQADAEPLVESLRAELTAQWTASAARRSRRAEVGT